MTLRRSLWMLGFATAACVVHGFLVQAMAEGHVAHVLLGAGNAVPPLSALLLAVSLLAVRFLTVVVVPGLVLAAVSGIVAHLLVGPKKEALPQRGAGSSSGAGSSEAGGTGTSIEGRGTQ